MQIPCLWRQQRIETIDNCVKSDSIYMDIDSCVYCAAIQVFFDSSKSIVS